MYSTRALDPKNWVEFSWNSASLGACQLLGRTPSHDVTLIWPLNLAVVTLTYKILSGLYLGNSKVRKLILGKDID